MLGATHHAIAFSCHVRALLCRIVPRGHSSIVLVVTLHRLLLLTATTNDQQSQCRTRHASFLQHAARAHLVGYLSRTRLYCPPLLVPKRLYSSDMRDFIAESHRRTAATAAPMQE
jgi:hypothetical protein